MDQYNPKVIAVSKTFKEQDILPLLDYGHIDFGENKVQEALLKWPKLKEKYKNVKLHMLGKMFIQINLGGEKQKSGIEPNDLEVFYKNCLSLKLDIVGTMCIPPDEQDPKLFFKELLSLNNKIKLPEISMGMTNDYLDALEYGSTYLRIGTGIFGRRTN